MAHKPKFKKARYSEIESKDLVGHIEIITDDGVMRIDPWDNKHICVTHKALPPEPKE